MQDLRTLFESEYPGKERLFEALIKPIFSKAKDTFLTDEQVLSDADKKQIKSFSIIAQVRGGFPIVFADVELQDTVALKRSRVNIQNCVRKVMENDSNAIIFFHFTDNAKEWRVSYVHRAETNRNSTSAKRYTYLCGPEHACRTVSERFETLKGLATIKDEDMIEAFSVEPLSKDFFERYREQYADLVEYISGKRFVKKGGKFVEEKTRNANGLFKNAFDGDDKAVRDFVKKMMGRLVFLQFLQKKGWLGVKTGNEWGGGDKNFLENLFKNAGKDVQDDFLEQALETLFFKTLNTSRDDEAVAPKKLCDIYGSSIRIPYLNGGLFEEDELDRKKVKFKKEHFSSLFEFFNQYNFTIDETDPDDTEIGVDPEMLGKIFENLLEDNKDKGAFYTPKEIVQYMCRESLIAYLSEKIPAEEKVRNFVLTHEPSFTGKEKADVLNALLDVKVCDPAVGSGAFPMGMLNELLACTQALTGEAKSRAELKKHIVKNNIYGVDIEKGAVDIARLRFWLAIIVDEEEPLPLPNLDYKIMQGNSLLENFEGIDLSHMLEKPERGMLDYTEELRTLLKTNIDEYFGDNSHEDKRKKNDVIKSCVFDLVCATCGLKQNSESALALHEKIWNGTSDFFLWHTWFNDVFSRPQKQGGVKSGFDIVIGNPPYVQLQNDGGKLASLYEKQGLESFAKAGDIYCLFYEKGASLLNETGTLCFITSNKWMRAGYGEKLRSYFAKNVDPKLLVDFAGVKIFENATVDTNILLFRKGKNKGKTQSCTTTTLTKDGLSNLSDFVQQNSSEC
ncbi:MAG: Eco57I restriction-modification methylase domain-containing protein, partial [Treponemataceae bacterium]|nr:Eco57I restriction-modification methylase domain-containing protein [Treponemataceae bacterium]